MAVKDILEKFRAVASNPAEQKEKYLKAGEKVVLCAPVYTPEEIIHSMGLVPMGAWGGDLELKGAKSYFPTFICSIVQSIVELGMKGCYEGVSAIVIPSLCDSLKVLGENWKYAVPSIPFIPMTYPQNRKPEYGIAYTRAGYERVVRDLEKATGVEFSEEKLAASIKIYNEHNQVMRNLTQVLSEHPEVTAEERSSLFKSGFFMKKEEHTALVKELIEALSEETPGDEKIKIVTTGVLTDGTDLLKILDEYGFHIVADDVAAESRQYRTDTEEGKAPLTALAEKFASMDNCSVLYDAQKKRIQNIADMAKASGAKGVLVVLTKFCDPEEFDYPLIKKACEEAGIPVVVVEVDRQMKNYEQARTAMETFRDMV